jgi:hypothetical protein
MRIQRLRTRIINYMSPPLPAEDLVAWMHAHDAPGGTRDASGTETEQEPAKVFAQRL